MVGRRDGGLRDGDNRERRATVLALAADDSTAGNSRVDRQPTTSRAKAGGGRHSVARPQLWTARRNCRYHGIYVLCELLLG